MTGRRCSPAEFSICNSSESGGGPRSLVTCIRTSASTGREGAEEGPGPQAAPLSAALGPSRPLSVPLRPSRAGLRPGLRPGLALAPCAPPVLRCLPAKPSLHFVGHRKTGPFWLHRLSCLAGRSLDAPHAALRDAARNTRLPYHRRRTRKWLGLCAIAWLSQTAFSRVGSNLTIWLDRVGRPHGERQGAGGVQAHTSSVPGCLARRPDRPVCPRSLLRS